MIAGKGGCRSFSENMEFIQKYFPDFTTEQLALYSRLHDLVLEWNTKLNLVSKSDAENLEERHLLSSLAIAKMVQFPKGSRIMDVGTGGGFPGLPLAIAFPECHFLLVDSIGKKIAAVADMVEKLGLENVVAVQERVETINQKFDFITGRAVKPLPLFMSWVKPRLKTGQEGGFKKGVIYLKGGDLSEEIKALRVKPYRKISLTSYYPEHEFFETKHVLHFAADDLLPKPRKKKKSSGRRRR